MLLVGRDRRVDEGVGVLHGLVARVLSGVLALAAAPPALGLVAPRDYVPHGEGAPGQPGDLVVRGNVPRRGDLVAAGCVLLVPSVSLGLFLALPRLFACLGVPLVSPSLSSVQCLEQYVRNFLCAIRFWILRLSSGSDTSAQSSDLGDLGLDFDDPDEECFLELDFDSVFEAWGAMLLVGLSSGEDIPASVDVRLRRNTLGTWRPDERGVFDRRIRGAEGSIRVFSGVLGDASRTRMEGTVVLSLSSSGGVSELMNGKLGGVVNPRTGS